MTPQKELKLRELMPGKKLGGFKISKKNLEIPPITTNRKPLWRCGEGICSVKHLQIFKWHLRFCCDDAVATGPQSTDVPKSTSYSRSLKSTLTFVLTTFDDHAFKQHAKQFLSPVLRDRSVLCSAAEIAM